MHRFVFVFALMIGCSGEQPATPTATHSDPATAVETTSAPPPVETTSVPPPVAPPPSNEPLTIDEPASGATVPHRPIVRGRVKIAQSKPTVWVIVHPSKEADYWVQPRADVDVDGSWSTQIYIGKDEGSHKDEHFKIMAVANPRKTLKRGVIIDDWPEAEYQSRIIEVIKK